MSNDKNIENFDSFFNEAFNSFEPTPPQGVFEAMQSQLGAGGSSSAATGAAAKAGVWGAGKVIISAVAAIAVATTIYIAVPSDNSASAGDLSEGTPAETEGALNNTLTQDLPESKRDNQNNSNTVEENNTSFNKNIESVNNISTNKEANNPLNNVTPISSENGRAEQESTPKAIQIGNSQGSKTPNSIIPPANNPNKVQVALYLSDKNLCTNERLTVTIADDISKNKYKVNFGDGSTVITRLGKPTIHKYKSKGRYKVMATSLSGNKETKEQWVDVSGVEAKFEAKLVNKATYTFENTSTNASHYNWFFGDNNREISQKESPSYTYKNFEPTTYKVKLIAMNSVGCLDSFSTYIKQSYTYEDKKPKMYNVFSPGVDGKNDHYEIEINDEEKYHVIILDKKGNKVFESTDKNNMWDGRNIYTGNNCPSANYVVVFSYKIKGFEQRQEKKFVTLVR